MSRHRRGLRAIGIIIFGVAALSPAFAAPEHSSPALDTDPAATLLRQDKNALVLYRDQQTGVPSYIGGALPAIKAAVATPLAAARAFFAENSGLFRMADAGGELALLRDETDRVGMNHVRFQQRYNGVEVFGGVLTAHTRGTRVASISGTYFPDLHLSTLPDLSFAQAAAQAQAAVGAPDGVVAWERSGLAIYAKGDHPALSWKVELLEARGPGRWLLFVDAHDGSIVHRIAMTQTARNRETHTMNNSSSSSGLPGPLLCGEDGVGCAGDPVVKAAHDNAGIVYDYYKNKFNRDSIDGNGMKIISSVHFDVDYNNAFWNGSQMVYGDGDGVSLSPLSQSMDVVAHELTHGITEFTAGLVYEDEPGALNESYSDVMGVFADAYSRGSSTVNWQLGEDVWTPGIAGDALRDMADPHKGNDPFTNAYDCAYRPGQPFYCGQPASLSEYARLPISFFEEVPSDTGGVHVNSGIPNKIANLIVDGGNFGGIAVAGIGAAKAEQIYYRTLAHYLAPYSNFNDARNYSVQACADLIGQFGISASDCASVRAGFGAAGIGQSIALDKQVFIPLVNQADLAPGLKGTVTIGNAPAAGVVLELRLCDDRLSSPCSTIKATATTNAGGAYVFPAGPNLPSATAHTWYRVVYLSPSDAPDGKLLVWIGDDIGAYIQGTTQRLDSFDIADVAIGAPNSATPQAFPVRFSWAPRAVGGDYYFWELYNSNFDVLALEHPSLMHTSASFTLNGANDQQLAQGSSLIGGAFWDVVVVSNAGYGYPWNSGKIAFASAVAGQGDAAARRALLKQRADQLRPQVVIRPAP